MNSDSSLNILIIDSVATENATDIATEFGEVAFDTLIETGALESVPVLGSLVKMAKAGISIRDRIFLKKVCGFLLELQSISHYKRTEFVNKLNEDIKYKKKVGENLLILLEKLDDIDKPALIGKLFRAYIVGEIDYEMFRRLTSAVDKMLLFDLKRLCNFNSEPKPIKDWSELTLISAGLIQDTGDGIGPIYLLTEPGNKMVNILYS